MARLRSLEPPGIGAHDIGDCLFLQLERLGLGNTAFDTLLHSPTPEDLAAGRFSKITGSRYFQACNQRQAAGRRSAILTRIPPQPLPVARRNTSFRSGVPATPMEKWNIHINDRWMLGSVGISTLW